MSKNDPYYGQNEPYYGSFDPYYSNVYHSMGQFLPIVWVDFSLSDPYYG
jgi:hypothetical protein